MAPRRAAKASGRKASASKQSQQTLDVVEALAGRLAQLGSRDWKASVHVVPRSGLWGSHLADGRCRIRARPRNGAVSQLHARCRCRRHCRRRLQAARPLLLQQPQHAPNFSRAAQVEELEAALEKAVSAVDDEATRAHIAANLRQCAQQLAERLRVLAAEQPQPQQQQQQQQQAAKDAKRPKRGARAAALAAAAAEADVTEAEMAEAQDELEHLPLLETAGGYACLAAAAVAGAPDARFTGSALLLARRLPAPELVLAHVQRLAPVPPPPEAGEAEGAAARAARSAALVAAAGVALGLCSALAADASTPEDALRMFAPAVSLLADAAQLAASADAQAPAAHEVAQLAARTLASMHAALEQQRRALAGGAAAAGGYWRSNPQAPSPAGAADAACSTGASLCSLLTTLRLHASGVAAAQPGSSRRRQQLDALAAAAAADLRLLAPYGPSGALDTLAGQLQQDEGGEEQQGGSGELSTLILYCGVAKHGEWLWDVRSPLSPSCPPASHLTLCLLRLLSRPSLRCFTPALTSLPSRLPALRCMQSLRGSGTTWPAWWRPAAPRPRRGGWGRRRWLRASRPTVRGRVKRGV